MRGPGGGAFAYASLWPGSRIFGEALIAPARPGELALTFDDGPNRHGRRGCSTFLPARSAGDVFSAGQSAPQASRSWCGASQRPGTRSEIIRGPSQPGATLDCPRARGTQQTSETLEQIGRHDGEVFPAAFWSAAAGGVSHCARAGPDAGAVERDDLRLERALGRADRGAADEKDRRAAAAWTRGEHRAARWRSSRCTRESRAERHGCGVAASSTTSKSYRFVTSTRGVKPARALSLVKRQTRRAPLRSWPQCRHRCARMEINAASNCEGGSQIP